MTEYGRTALAGVLAAGLAAIAMVQPASAKGTAFTAQSSASVSGEGEDAVMQTVNSTYSFEILFEPGSAELVDLLIEQRLTSQQPRMAEAPLSELVATARTDAANGYSRKLWTITDNANEGALIGDYYRTTLYGCCGAENLYRHYWGWSGKLAFLASTDPVFASIPNTPTTRVFGYVSANTFDGLDLERWPNGAGMVKLVDGEKVVDRLLLETEPGANYQWTPTVTLVDPAREDGGMNGDTLDLWASNGNPDPAGITGFQLVLTWESQSGEVAILPVTADRFDLAAAQLPEGLTARRIDGD